MKVGITGASGLIGRHLASAVVKSLGADSLVIAGRAAFDPTPAGAALLKTFSRSCDVIVHLAGVNRENDHDRYADNPRLARQLVQSLEDRNRPITLIYSSSIQTLDHTNYGQSKTQATEIFKSAFESGSSERFVNLILPHIFGEFGKPFHNSAVSTFCYQLAHSQNSVVTQDKELELLHASDLADQILEWIDQTGSIQEHRPSGIKISVTEVLAKLQLIFKNYVGLPNWKPADPFEEALLRTLRSYLGNESYPLRLSKTTNPSKAEKITIEPGQTHIIPARRKEMTRVGVLSGSLEIQFQAITGILPELPSWQSPDSGGLFDIPSHYGAQLLAQSRCEIVLSS